MRSQIWINFWGLFFAMSRDKSSKKSDSWCLCSLQHDWQFASKDRHTSICVGSYQEKAVLFSQTRAVFWKRWHPFFQYWWALIQSIHPNQHFPQYKSILCCCCPDCTLFLNFGLEIEPTQSNVKTFDFGGIWI